MRDIAKRRREGSGLARAIDRFLLAGRSANLYPLLIAAWQRYGDDGQRREILHLFDAFVFRVYRVVRFRSNTALSWLHSLAERVHRHDLAFPDFLQQFRELIQHYVNDDMFRRELSQTHVYPNLGTRTIKYLLAEYERKRQADVGEPLPLDLRTILSGEYQTEHVLPQHPAGGLDQEEAAAHDQIVHRLGNLTLASRGWNLRMGNRGFAEKRDGGVDSEPDAGTPCYRNSSLRVQRDLAKWEEWNEASIQERGEEIIDFALRRWRVGPEDRAGG